MFSLSTRVFSIILISMVIITGVVIYWIVADPQPSSQPLSQETQNDGRDSLFHGLFEVKVVHGATAQDLTCSTCHTSPIPFTDCLDCHSSIPLNITDQGIDFAHHNPSEAPSEVTCQDCHASSENDARWVQVPIADHDYCDDCHSSIHD